MQLCNRFSCLNTMLGLVLSVVDSGDLHDEPKSKETGIRAGAGKNKRTVRKNTGTNQRKMLYGKRLPFFLIQNQEKINI